LIRALIISAAALTTANLSGSCTSCEHRRVEMAVAAPQQGLITGKHGHKVRACGWRIPIHAAMGV